MWFQRFFSNQSTTGFCRPRKFPRNKRTPKKQNCGKLTLEPLEDRCLLDGSFGPWTNVTNLGDVVNTPYLDQRGTISKDGLSLYFGSNRPGSVGTVEGSDLYVTQRASANDPWGPPQKVEALSSIGDDNAPAFSPDCHWVYFGSDRPGGCGGYDIWAAHRKDTGDNFGWEPPINLGCTVNSPQNDDGPTYFEDENGAVTLYFTSQRPGGQGDYDIYASQATSDDHLSFGPASNVTELNSPRRDTRTTISRDELEMFITSNRVGSVPDSTGAPSLDIWVSTRVSTADAWSAPVNLGAPINTSANDGAPSLSFDGTSLYFDSTRQGGFGSRDLYVATREKLKDLAQVSDSGTAGVAVLPSTAPVSLDAEIPRNISGERGQSTQPRVVDASPAPVCKSPDLRQGVEKAATNLALEGFFAELTWDAMPIGLGDNFDMALLH